MTNDHIQTIAHGLSERFAVTLDVVDWREMEFFGGIAFVLREVDNLCRLARHSGDSEVIAYEMESLDRDFPPTAFPVDADGMRNLSNSWMAHFELLLVPPSKAWAIAITPDMEAFLLGPKKFVDAFLVEPLTDPGSLPDRP